MTTKLTKGTDPQKETIAKLETEIAELKSRLEYSQSYAAQLEYEQTIGLDADDYQKGCLKTANLGVPLEQAVPTHYSVQETQHLLRAFTLCSALGQYLGPLKKGIFHHHGLDEFVLGEALYHVTEVAMQVTDQRFTSGGGAGFFNTPWSTALYHLSHPTSPAQGLATRTLTQEEAVLVNMAMGLVEEAIEFMGEVVQGLASPNGIDVEKAGKELGDGLWYGSVAAAAGLKLKLSQVMWANLRKLAGRYKKGFSVEASLNRDAETEAQEQQETTV